MPSKCVSCGSPLRAGTSLEVVEVGGLTYKKDIDALCCTGCDESYVSAETLQSFEQEVASAIAHSGQVNGDTFRFMRKALGMTAQELAPLLGVSPETISRWENGATVDRTAWITMGAIAIEAFEKQPPRTLERLRRAADGRAERRRTINLNAR